ncbi:MAG: type II secretion system F family protein [Micavibrio sp.]|nr:type II secretion system F family protein [Micavibrio sp.]
MSWLAFVLVLLAILAIAGAFAMSVNKRQQQRNRVLSVITRAGAAKEDSAGKQNMRQRADIARKLKDAGKEEEKKKDKVTIREMMQQAGIDAPVSRFWIASAIFAAVTCLFLLEVLSWPPVAVIFATFAAFLGVPRLVLRIKAKRRQKKFLTEFPDALDGCVRLLQAGMPISEAIAMVSREYTGPLREEMLRIYDNQRIGVPLGQAAKETTKRIPLTEVHMFATALQIQSETGSSLSEILSNLSNVIRQRFRLRRKVQALSSEAISSAAIIGSLPFIVSFGLWCVNPKYMDPLLHTPHGHIYLVFCGIWMTCGILVMRAMINFKI